LGLAWGWFGTWMRFMRGKKVLLKSSVKVGLGWNWVGRM